MKEFTLLHNTAHFRQSARLRLHPDRHFDLVVTIYGPLQPEPYILDLAGTVKDATDDELVSDMRLVLSEGRFITTIAKALSMTSLA